MSQMRQSRPQGEARRSAQSGAPRSAQGSAPRRAQSSAPRSAQGPARRLTPEQRQRILERRRRERARKRRMLFIAALVALLIVVLVVVLLTRGRKEVPVNVEPEEPAVEAVNTQAPEEATEEPDSGEETAGAQEAQVSDGDAAGALDGGVTEDADVVAPSGDAGASLTTGQTTYVPEGGTFVFDEAYVHAALGEVTGPDLVPDMSKVDPAKLNRWPEAEEGYMPVIWNAENMTEKIIAITVDDCFQGNNLRDIVQCALDYGGRLTIFPIGSNLERSEVASAVKWAWESGMEIENHTYNHVGMYHYDDERMTKEIYLQNMKLNQVLGVSYQQHFFRPKGGDEYKDQRVHAYVNQRGMSALALWSVTGSLSTSSFCRNQLKPGAVYLFHTTDADKQLILDLIPYAVSQGYQFVTMNDLFGLPANETAPLGEIDINYAPPLQAFKIIPAMLMKTSYMRAAAVVQKRLIELGWLTGEADGVFGDSSYRATGYFQLKADIKADGKAGAQTQAVLFSEDAPRKS